MVKRKEKKLGRLPRASRTEITVEKPGKVTFLIWQERQSFISFFDGKKRFNEKNGLRGKGKENGIREKVVRATDA